MDYNPLETKTAEAGFDFALPGTGIWLTGYLALPYNDDIALLDPRTLNRFTDSAYNIVEMSDGRLTIYGCNERQTLFRYHDDEDDGTDGRISFASEDEACDWIWKRLTKLQPPITHRVVTQEQLAAQEKRPDEEYVRKLAVYNREHGLT